MTVKSTDIRNQELGGRRVLRGIGKLYMKGKKHKMRIIQSFDGDNEITRINKQTYSVVIAWFHMANKSFADNTVPFVSKSLKVYSLA